MENIISTNNGANHVVAPLNNNSGNSVQLELPFANYDAAQNLNRCDALIDKMVQSEGIVYTINVLLLKTQIIKSRTIIAFFRHDAKYLTISYDHFIRDFCAGQILCTRRTFEQARDYVKIINNVDNPELQNKLKSLSVSVARHLFQFLDKPDYLKSIKSIFDKDVLPTEAEIKDFVRMQKSIGTRAIRAKYKPKKHPKKITTKIIKWDNNGNGSNRNIRRNIHIIISFFKAISYTNKSLQIVINLLNEILSSEPAQKGDK